MAAGNQVGSLWERMNSSFWFIPGLLTVGGFLLALLTQPLDSLVQPVLDQLPTIISGGAQGAGDVLSAIAGSLITVIATVFSLTIVIFALTSGQYSPRMLWSLTSDRRLQVVLGFFVGTFVYCLLVLRLIKVSAGAETGFHPVESVAVAILLALVCVALLIYFIGYVTLLIGVRHRPASPGADTGPAGRDEPDGTGRRGSTRPVTKGQGRRRRRPRDVSELIGRIGGRGEGPGGGGGLPIPSLGHT